MLVVTFETNQNMWIRVDVPQIIMISYCKTLERTQLINILYVNDFEAKAEWVHDRNDCY